MNYIPSYEKYGERYVIFKDFKSYYGQIVPKNFISDGMSSPFFTDLFGIGNNNNACLYSAFVHDFEYSKSSEVSRLQADKNLYKNLRKYGLDIITSRLVYDAVRAFGESHYEGRGNCE